MRRIASVSDLSRAPLRGTRLRACEVRACGALDSMPGLKIARDVSGAFASRTAAAAAAGTRYIHEAWNSRRPILLVLVNFVTPPSATRACPILKNRGIWMLSTFFMLFFSLYLQRMRSFR